MASEGSDEHWEEYTYTTPFARRHHQNRVNEYAKKGKALHLVALRRPGLKLQVFEAEWPVGVPCTLDDLVKHVKDHLQQHASRLSLATACTLQLQAPTQACGLQQQDALLLDEVRHSAPAQLRGHPARVVSMPAARPSLQQTRPLSASEGPRQMRCCYSHMAQPAEAPVEEEAPHHAVWGEGTHRQHVAHEASATGPVQFTSSVTPQLQSRASVGACAQGHEAGVGTRASSALSSIMSLFPRINVRNKSRSDPPALRMWANQLYSSVTSTEGDADCASPCGQTGRARNVHVADPGHDFSSQALQRQEGEEEAVAVAVHSPPQSSLSAVVAAASREHSKFVPPKHGSTAPGHRRAPSSTVSSEETSGAAASCLITTAYTPTHCCSHEELTFQAGTPHADDRQVWAPQRDGQQQQGQQVLLQAGRDAGVRNRGAPGGVPSTWAAATAQADSDAPSVVYPDLYATRCSDLDVADQHAGGCWGRLRPSSTPGKRHLGTSQQPTTLVQHGAAKQQQQQRGVFCGLRLPCTQSKELCRISNTSFYTAQGEGVSECGFWDGQSSADHLSPTGKGPSDNALL